MMSKLQKKYSFHFKGHLGCALHARSLVFFQNFQNTAFLLLYYSALQCAIYKILVNYKKRFYVQINKPMVLPLRER